MPRKQWTPEQRQAARDRMAKLHEAQRAARGTKTAVVEAPPTVQPEPPMVPETGPELTPGQAVPTTISTEDYIDLLKQINEMKSMMLANQNQGSPETSQKGMVGFSGGALVGTIERYDVTPGAYADPRERLFLEQRLAPFAPQVNYELNWLVNTSEYTTIDNMRVKEPKFTLELVRIILDEETGEQTNGRYIVCRLIMHEDPEAALVIARANGIDVEAMEEAKFLDEMRYLRMRDWLVECFYPAPIKKDHKKKEMVIGGKIVEFYEVTSETPEKIDFGSIKDHKL